jgi:hypothetical protein
VGAALLVLDIVGPRALDALAVSDRLFSGGAEGLVVAALTVTLVCVRIAVCCILPGVLLAALVFRLSGTQKAGPQGSASNQ